jgi:hypothetical protein
MVPYPDKTSTAHVAAVDPKAHRIDREAGQFEHITLMKGFEFLKT